MSMFRRSSYTSVLLLSYQSCRSSLSMSGHILQMTNSIVKSETLASKADVDNGLSEQFAESSNVDLVESENLKNHALELEYAGAKEVSMSHVDAGKEKYYQVKATKEQGEADALGLEAAADEKLYEEEMEKSLSESAAASKEVTRTESDAVFAATGVCEVIPFFDLVCDFVGSIASIGLESHAAKLAAQGSLDAAGAIAAKSEEDELLAQVNALREKSIEDESAAADYSGNAKEKEAIASRDKAEAEKEETEALELAQKGNEEETMAGKEQLSAEEEEVEATNETSNAMKHCLLAFRDAILAGVFSFLSMTFFLIRFLISIVFPAGAAVMGFVPNSNTLESGRKAASAKEWIGNLWRILPKREISYFSLHCSIFVVTMIAFSSQLAVLDQVNVRSQGGSIICFSVTAALIQSALLHVLPMAVDFSRTRDDQSPFTALMVVKVSMQLCRGLMYFVPLFLIEVLELRMLSSKYFFSVDLPRFMNITVLFGILIFFGAIFAFSCTRETYKTVSMKFSNDQMSETVRLLQDEDKNYNALEVCRSTNNSEIYILPASSRDSVLSYGSSAEQNLNAEVSTELDTMSALYRYIYDLKLPFELLVMTCMFVKLRECSPIIAKLLPRILQSHPHFFLECGVIALVMLAVLWCLLSSNKRHGHVGVWTGRLGGRFQ